MHIQVETKESLLIWQITRPERRNALGTILSQELWEKVKELQINLEAWQDLPGALNEPPRVLAIKVASTKGDSSPIWIAGGDLKELNELKTPAEGRNYAETMARVCEGLYNLPIPVVVLIDGLVIGGGIEFALAADFRFVTHRTRFHFKQLALGLATAYASSQRLIQLVGVSKAMNWLLRSKMVTAQDALNSGLVHEVLDSTQELEDELSEFVDQILSLPRAGVSAQKQMLHAGGIDPKRRSDELDLFASLWMNPYHQERLKEFLGPKG
ncbi:MAG: enoyl-CoA hydratase/isomerase family protein [Proteobacteria bacterium]|nr:MAG: enoyl-CoA hydratase/isomerase family protein [Pseudomonadota bacterium]